MEPLKIEYTIYNRPVIYDGVVYPSVGIIDVSDKFSFGDKEEVCSSIFGKDEDDVIAQAEGELRDMLPERYKNVAIELVPKLTEKLNDYKPILYETFFKDPVHYYVTDCGNESADK